MLISSNVVAQYWQRTRRVLLDLSIDTVTDFFGNAIDDENAVEVIYLVLNTVA